MSSEPDVPVGKVRFDIVIKSVVRVPGVKVTFGMCRQGTTDEFVETVNLGEVLDSEIMDEIKKYINANEKRLCKTNVVGSSSYVDVDEGNVGVPSGGHGGGL